MQTFLPYSDYELSAKSLDMKRLGKQRVETKQILFALSNQDYGWQNHPAIKMWRGHEYQLCLYGITICDEWRKRGYKDQQWSYFWGELRKLAAEGRICDTKPSWLNHNFCRSHQSNLIRKKPEYYAPKFPGVPMDLEYIWPVK